MSQCKTYPTQARLAELFAYDQEGGTLTHRGTPSNRVKPGAAAGCLSRGYVVVRVDGILFSAHCVIWKMMTGEWPTDPIDHINGVKNDNRWANLRKVTPKTNSQNLRGPHADNRAGLLGVTRVRTGKFSASIWAQGERHHLGTFSDPEVAHATYIAAKRRMHPGCTI